MPNPLATGHLQLSFTTHPPPHSHLPLSLIRPSHFPLAVIGIALCTRADPLPSIFAQFDASLVDVIHSDGIYPLAKNCFVFEEGDDTSLDLSSDLPGLVLIPSMMGNKKLYIGTLLADLCSQILGEFGVLVYIFWLFLFCCSHGFETGTSFRKSSGKRIPELNAFAHNAFIVGHSLASEWHEKRHSSATPFAAYTSRYGQARFCVICSAIHEAHLVY